MFSFYRKDVRQIYNEVCLWQVKNERRRGLGIGTKGTSTGIRVSQRQTTRIHLHQVCWRRAHWRKAMEIYQGPWYRYRTMTPTHLHIVQHPPHPCTARELWSLGYRCFKRNNFWNSGSSLMYSRTRILLWYYIVEHWLLPCPTNQGLWLRVISLWCLVWTGYGVQTLQW